MLNQINIMGRFVKAPELKTTTSGVKLLKGTIACDRNGDRDNRKTDFVDITAWRATAEFISKYFHKGDMIAITGRLQSDKWTDKDGNKRVSWYINVEDAYFTGSKRSGPTAVDVEAPAELGDIDDDDGDLPWKMGDDDELPL